MAFRVTDKKNATRGIGYTRIGRVTGGAASLVALCNMTPICRTGRGNKRPHVESGRRRGKPPIPEPTTRKQA